jgi:hypothetical protein
MQYRLQKEKHPELAMIQFTDAPSYSQHHHSMCNDMQTKPKAMVIELHDAPLALFTVSRTKWVPGLAVLAIPSLRSYRFSLRLHATVLNIDDWNRRILIRFRRSGIRNGFWNHVGQLLIS